jgi:hypothetical protein
MGGGAFMILEFEDENLDDLLYRETATDQSIARDDPELIADYRDAFVKLEAMATKPDDLANVLDAIGTVRFHNNSDSLTASPIPPELIE